MCNVLVLDDSTAKIAWLAGVVKSVFQCLGHFTFLPRGLHQDQSVQIPLIQRSGPLDAAARREKANSLLDWAGVSNVSSVDIAIIDLCLSHPAQLHDPEGLWLSSAIRERFPECFIILVSGKATVDHAEISGGWFKYVPPPPVRIDEVVGLREDDIVSSESQLQAALQKYLNCRLVA